jgi:hypothetical protein
VVDNGPADTRLDTPAVRLLDVNGDGLPDIVKVTTNGTNNTWQVYKNTGSSWNTASETWINNAPVDAYLGKVDTTLSDVNGDGLLDIVKSHAHDNSYNIWKVLVNNGNSWATTYETWIDDQQIDPDITGNIVRLADATGDGLPDIVKGEVTPNGGQAPYNTWSVYRNTGKAAHVLQSVRTAQGGIISFDYQPAAHFDNTGADSVSDLPFSLWLVDKMTVHNGMATIHQTNDVTMYSYKDGFYNWQDREFRALARSLRLSPLGQRRSMSSIRMMAAKEELPRYSTGMGRITRLPRQNRVGVHPCQTASRLSTSPRSATTSLTAQLILPRSSRLTTSMMGLAM